MVELTIKELDAPLLSRRFMFDKLFFQHNKFVKHDYNFSAIETKCHLLFSSYTGLVPEPETQQISSNVSGTSLFNSRQPPD